MSVEKSASTQSQIKVGSHATNLLFAGAGTLPSIVEDDKIFPPYSSL
jgi:hypothetical protein